MWAHPGLSLASACLLGEFWLAEPHVYHVCGGRAECRQKDTVSCSTRGFRGQTAGWRLKTDIRLVFLSQDGLQQLPHEQHPTRPAAYAGNRLWVQTLFGFSCLFFVVQTVCLKLGGENRFALYTKEKKEEVSNHSIIQSYLTLIFLHTVVKVWFSIMNHQWCVLTERRFLAAFHAR